MATKGQKIGFTVTTAILFGTANVFQKYSKAQKENKQYTFTDGLKDALGGVAVGAITGRVAAEIFGEPNDTVNYSLFNKNRKKKIVYHGIAYEEIVETNRIRSHVRDGKIFTHFKYDTPKPRSEARMLEQMRIMRDKPIYNIQHNCD